MNAKAAEVVQSTELMVVETAISDMNAVAAGLADLSKRFKGVVFDVTTVQGMKDAKAARREVSEPRIKLEKIREAAKRPILDLGRKLDGEAARIKRELEAIEKPIADQIDAEERRVEAERQAKIKAEQDRVAGIQKRIADIEGAVATCAKLNDPEAIGRHYIDITAIAIDESFGEFQETAGKSKASALASLNDMRNAAIERKSESERLAAERAELDRRQAEQQQREREAAERAEADRQRRAEMDARMNALRGNQALTAMSGIVAIAAEMVTISSKNISPLEFGDQTQAAQALQLETLERLKELHKAATAYEAEQARQAEERARQQAESQRIASENAALDARQRAEREAQEAREKKERDEQAAKEEEERQRREAAARAAFVPSFEDIVTVVADHWDRDKATARKWITDAALSQ